MTAIATLSARPRGRAGTVAPEVRHDVLNGGTRFWAVDDFPHLDPRLVDKAMLRLRDAGDLVSVRRGLYYRGKKWSWGMERPPTDQVVAKIAGRDGVGPAGLSAANELGLTTQVPAMDTYAVPGPAPRALPTAKFLSRPSRTARSRAHLRPMEVAFLEVLDAWTGVMDVSPSQAVKDLVAVLQSSTVEPRRLANGAADEPPAARERLKYLLNLTSCGTLADTIRGASGPGTRERALAGMGVGL